MESPRLAKRRKVEETSTTTPTSTATPTHANNGSSARRTKGATARINGTPLQQRAEAVSTPLTATSRKSIGNTEVDVFDDIDGANTPTSARSTSTRPKSTLGLADRRELSLKASAHGLNSLRARLNARLAAQEKEKQAKAGAADSPTVSAHDNTEHTFDDEEQQEESREGTPKSVGRPRKVTATVLQQEAEERKENEQTKFEEEQYEKAIKRMAAKAKAADRLKAKARGETLPKDSTPVRSTPKSAVDGVRKQTLKATPRSGKKELKMTLEVPQAEVDIPDDTACRVCSKLNSAKTNPMVVCDGCEHAYHQKCHVPPISNKILKEEDSEWFCAECAFKRAATTGAATFTKSKPAPKPRKAPPVEPDMPDEIVNGEELDVIHVEPALPTAAKSQPGWMERMKNAMPKRKDPVRELSPMILDLPGEDTAPRNPSKAASAVKALPKPTRQPSPKLHQANASADLSISHSDLKSLKLTVLEQLTNRRQHNLIGLGTETQQIASLVDQTISSGESNSLLVIGARGSGKTAVVESILHEQGLKNADVFHAVRLNGFTHTDDKIALREIWRQLGREMQTEELDTGGKNYADALTTLLALLSHPSEFGQDITGENGEAVKSKSVVFILDEFDLFTTHPRQTLLYNLFDIAQSRKAPILVLGLTTRFDVAEQLEKRVKSRFSHRFVHLGLAKNLDTFTDMCRSCLLPANNDDSHIADSGVSKGGTETWRALLSDLFSTEEMTSAVRKIYYTTKSVPAFQSSMLIPFSTLPSYPSSPSANDHNMNDSTHQIPTNLLLTHLLPSTPTIPASTSPPDSKLQLLHSLSTLHLALLISAARLSIIHTTDFVSFALAYDHYTHLASRARIQSSASASFSSSFGAAGSGAAAGVNASGVGRVWSKDVAREAWEGLCKAEFVMLEAGAGAAGRGGKAGLENALGRVDVLLEEIVETVGGEMGMVMRGWCREI